MDGLTTRFVSGSCFLTLLQSLSSSGASHRAFALPIRPRRPSSVLAASRDDAPSPTPDLDHWKQMELKLGRLVDKEPKLTLAKTTGGGENPDSSYVEIKRPFYGKEKNGQLTGAVEEVPLDWAVKEPNPTPSRRDTPVAGLRTPATAGTGAAAEPELKLSRPDRGKGIRNAAEGEPVPSLMVPQTQLGKDIAEKGGPELLLRKPPHLPGVEIKLEKPSKLKVKAILKSAQSDSLSELTLLKKPEVGKVSSDAHVEEKSTASSTRAELQSHNDDFVSESSVPDNLAESEASGWQHSEGQVVRGIISEATSPQDTLMSKPPRLDLPLKEECHSVEVNTSNINHEFSNDNNEEILLTAEQQANEENDWIRAEELLQTGDRAEVELISCNAHGFVVSFSSLVGYLPYKNLGAKWKFLAFESWLRKKGLDPSLYRYHLSIIGKYSVQEKDSPVASDGILKKNKDELDSDTTFEELVAAYNNERTEFLSYFLGQRIRAYVVMVDRSSRRIMFSGRQKEEEELVQKRRSLMAKLNIGDTVKCCVKKLKFFGIFVEIDGVKALIHHSEVPWDDILDPSSMFKVGQIIEAKVYQLDYSLEHIALSIKETMPNPLNETLESVGGEHANVGIDTVQGDIEWLDVESLVKDLERIDGVISVSKGRFSWSSGLAPTFQVYMGSMHENGYKLRACFENKVQEIIVQASLDEEQMKAAIQTCTNLIQ